MAPEILIESGDGHRTQMLLTAERVVIGRSRESDVFLPDQWLSRQHAEIRRRGDEYLLADLGSKNGTLLNGAQVSAEIRLRDGDVITLGEHTITFRVPSLPEADEDREPEGTRVFSARELSRVAAGGATDAHELLRQNRLLSILSRSTGALLLHRPLPELFEQILDLLFEAVPAERAAILLLEGTPSQPVVKASRTRRGEPITRVSRSIARRALEELNALLIPNILEDASLKGQDSILATGIRSAMCAPLWFRTAEAGEDAVIGLVYLDTRERGRSFSEEDLQVLTAFANVAAAKIENVRLLEESLEKRRMEEDMRVAAEIQRSLLPREAPRPPGYDLVGSNQPCRTVGGDYYDFELAEGRLLLALGDVSGKGTGAALLMTVLRAAVRAHWESLDPAEAMVRINRTVCQNVPQNKYVTFFMARLDPASGGLVYVNAGHNPPLLLRADGSVETLEEGGMVLGLLEAVPYHQGRVRIAPGDVLLIFSDGITETWNAAEEEFGTEGVLRLATPVRGLSAARIQEALLGELERFAGGAKATDDRTLIVLRRLPAS